MQRGRPAYALHVTALANIKAWADEGYGVEDIAVRLRASRLPVDISTIRHEVMDVPRIPNPINWGKRRD